MFVVDIKFQGEAAAVERIFVRRPYFTIGASETSHVVVSEMESLGLEIQIQRDLARAFKLSTLSLKSDLSSVPIDGTYNGEASIDIGCVSFSLIALDLDLLIKENEAVDRAGVRILRRAFGDTVPDFPALMVTFPEKALLSFWPDQPIVIGRSRGASVRLDVPTVSLQHARIGFESGQFWVEDLGSTNGTFIGEKQIASRMPVSAGTPIWISKNACVMGIMSHQQLSLLNQPL